PGAAIIGNRPIAQHKISPPLAGQKPSEAMAEGQAFAGCASGDAAGPLPTLPRKRGMVIMPCAVRSRREMRKYLALAFCFLAASTIGAIADTWPARPVKVIVGFAPGGPTDLVARLVAQKLAEQTGKNFYVENLAGAGGNVGTLKAAQSPPDGYTILVTGGNITNNQFLFAHPGYDPLKDFDAVTLAAQTPVVLAVNPSVPAKTVKELVEWIKANPGKESYASPGTGT